MTFSLCVHEAYEDDAGEQRRRFGVAVTTRMPGVGILCPFASTDAAVSTQSITNPDLGRRGVRYVGEGLAIEDALQALLNADPGAGSRQVHGVSADGAFAHSGADCVEWFGHEVGDGYTVAGNMLAGESVIAETAAAYEAGDPAEPLPGRLIEALAAGQAAGGDKREDQRVQSAAVRVATTEPYDRMPYTHDLRVDASETPIRDLERTHALAVEGYELAMERYGDAIREGAFGG